MNCERWRLAAVSDDPAERAAAGEHAAGCPTCGPAAAMDKQLEAAIRSWLAATPEPSAALTHRIEELGAPIRASGFRPRGWGLWKWTAAAALFLAGIGVGLYTARLQPPTREWSSRLILGESLHEVENQEAERLDAVNRLAAAAQAVLARAADPRLAPAEAQRLKAWRNELQNLDRTIARLQAFLEQNSGHGGTRSLLQHALRTKQRVLEQVLAQKAQRRDV